MGRDATIRVSFVLIDVSQMNLTVDVGNTRIKLGVFDAHNFLKSVAQFAETQTDALQNFCAGFKIEKVMVCASGKIPEVFNAFLNAHYTVFYLTHESPLPILNNYATPKTLGKDRLAAVVGAAHLHPYKNCLVVVTGTALTFNILYENTFLGGTISVGLQMRFNALHHFTAHLPQLNVESANAEPFVGNDTTQAINSGVLNGYIAEVEGMIARYEKQFGALKIIFSGGNSTWVSENINRFDVETEPNIVLIGLNALLPR